ncbi:methyl-accepting chemotaxis protein [Clostridium fermenticellae]|uniref:Methyl-accepting chemotaxis protein n=1 Tax=Clostridium fermenticellae TaxID=2068654 RepID=A0A386H6N3_9CLOT|nr:methyl-accepting chemotaxis protein [Clostridium fermenticellae]AYD41175.1 methyl-accepting chemotaxis protein [Clostridium fermenticellae]
MNSKNSKLNNIRIKLVTSLILICVIPLLISGFISYSKSKSILNQKLILTTTQTIDEIDDGLSNYLNVFSKLVSISAANPGIINYDTSNDNDALSYALKNMKENDKDIFQAYYGTASHKFTIYPYSKMPTGYDPPERDWYKTALRNKGKITISQPYIDAATKDNVITFSQTVEKDGQVVGVVALDCSLKTLSQEISSKKVGNSGSVFLVDPTGKAIASPEKNLINTDISSKFTFWSKAKSEDSGFVNYTYNGVKKFGAFTTNKLTGWKVIATLNDSELSKDTKPILHITLLMILIMALAAAALSFTLSKGISDNINNFKKAFSKASKGDLTVSIAASTKDEFKDLSESFNTMLKNVSDLMNNVTKSSETVLQTSLSLANMSGEVTSSVTEVSKAIEEVSMGATKQAENAQTGAAEMNSLSNKLDEISNNSNEIDKISRDTKELGSTGLSMIDTLIEKSNKTKDSTTSVNKVIFDMNESAKQINVISEAISDITEQTNLLSLNASIESARAGEAGKGFAVVAEEIRVLAEQSQNSAKEIKGIIATIQKKSETAVDAINSTEVAVNEQYKAVNKTQEIFNKILKSIEIMIGRVDEVKKSIIDMNDKKQSTLAEIEDISSISEETASASEEVTASSEEISATMQEFTRHSEKLKTLAEELKDEINQFKIN